MASAAGCVHDPRPGRARASGPSDVREPPPRRAAERLLGAAERLLRAVASCPAARAEVRFDVVGTLDFCRSLTARATTVQQRRALFRREMRPAGYRGIVHLGFLVFACSVPAAAALLGVSTWDWRALLAAGSSFSLGMAVVYFGHRYPMHHSMPGLRWIYDVHTRCHHMMFDEGQTEIDSLDDCGMVMFPMHDIAALCGLGVPLLAVPWLGLGTDAALASAAFGYLYYLGYELVHLASHGRVGGPLDRVPGLGFMLRHHRRHHAWTVMHRVNFSMLVPLLDWVFGTFERGRRSR